MREIKTQGVKKNLFFQTLYQALVLIIPFFIAPYLTRVILEDNIGVYTYVNSIASYFVLLANLGISSHGQRILAGCKEDEVEFRKNFWSLWLDHALVSVFSTVLYLILALTVFKEDQCVYLLQSILVASALFDVTWLFYGLQNMKIVVLANLFCRVAYLVSVFVFVRSADDFYVYVLIASLGTFVPCLITFIVGAVHFPFVFPERRYFLKHWKPMFVLSLASIASTLYTTFDKTIIGIYLPKSEVAFYEYANKILTIPKSILATIGTVMYPKICSLLAKGENEEAKRLRSYSIDLTTIFSIAAAFGLLAVSDRFIALYYGENFLASSDYLKLMCPLVYIILLGDVFRSQCLIPNKKDWIYIASLFISAGVNTILNFALIGHIGVYGVIIGSIAAELAATVFEWIFARKDIRNLDVLKSFLFFGVDGALMLGLIYLLSGFISTTWLFLLVSVLAGAVVYLSLALIYLFLVSSNREAYKAKAASLLKRTKDNV